MSIPIIVPTAGASFPVYGNRATASPFVPPNAIFAGMMPFMGIQVIAVVILYVFLQISLWLPSVVYGR